MTDKAIVAGEFSHFKHIKTRKVVVLEIEIPEELFQDAISKLGMPIGGESKPVAVALLDKAVIKENITTEYKFPVGGAPSPVNIQLTDTLHYKTGQTEGEKLRIRAVLLGKDSQFQEYMNAVVPSSVKGLPSETEVAWWIKGMCKIKSRSELATNLDAQQKFRELLEKFKNWQFENNHKDNLGRL